jgi:hypothetical protein
MKRIIFIAVILAGVVGCTYPWVRNQETGEVPIMQGLSDAIGQAVSGNWIGAIVGLVGGTVTGCFATKKKKNNQLLQIVGGVEEFKKLGDSDALLNLLSKYMNSDTKKLVKKLIRKLPDA